MEYLRSPIINTHIASIKPIETPIQLKERIVNYSEDLVIRTRQEISDILYGRDTRRLIMIVGPCSIHDSEQAAEYAERLIKVKKLVEDDLVVVMRTYFEKPRTTVGWKGLVYDPHLDGSSEPGAGLALSRQILVNINGLGLPCAAEFLDPLTPQYLDDLVSWVAIGARTTESQIHRQLASGLSSPVGFKNSTDGNIKIAVDAMEVAASSHQFYGIDKYGQIAEVETIGNPNTHLVLRGGSKGVNYDEVSIKEALGLISRRGLLAGLSRPIMIDCSHGNSAKDYTKQSSVAGNILEQIQFGQYRIMGMMLESNLAAGKQEWTVNKPLQYGVSITDACIDWRETEHLLLQTARTIQTPRYLLV